MFISALPLLLLAGSPQGLHIEWQAPPGCPSAAVLRRRIRAELVDTPLGPPLSVHGTVSRVEDAVLRLDVTVFDNPTQKTRRASVLSGHCDELAEDFIAHVKALWRSQATTPSHGRPRLRLRTAANTTLPAEEHRWFVGGQLVVGLQWPRARLELGLSGDSALPGYGNTRYRIERAQVLVRGCGELSLRTVELHLCGGLESGAVVYRTDAGSPSVAPTLNLQAGPAITWWIHRNVGLWLGATALGRLLQPVVTEGYSRLKFCPECPDPARDRFSFAGGLGLEFRWGR